MNRFDPEKLIAEVTEQFPTASIATVSQAALAASYALGAFAAACKFHRLQVPGLPALAEDLHYLGSYLSDYAEG